MANSRHVGPEQALQASVLDRLLDDDPAHSTVHSLMGLQSGMRRDLEALLNTHQYCKALPRELDQLGESLLDYGMPHFLGLSMASVPAREQFRVSVETVIHRFEPRLKQVRVILLENTDNLDRTLRFRIEALMVVAPELEPVCFDSVLETANRRFLVTTVLP
jgi:type VI secretion system protein ImpF